MEIEPLVGCSIPARQRSNVVFPEPDGPNKTVNVPGSTTRDTPLSAIFDPNFLRTSEISTREGPVHTRLMSELLLHRRDATPWASRGER